MSKIEERHDDELMQAVNFGNLQSLEQQRDDLLKTGTPDDFKQVEELTKKIVEASKLNLGLFEKLSDKIESNHERRLRYNQVLSLNYKNAKTKTQELSSFIADKSDNPEQILIAKEIEAECRSAIHSLAPTLKVIFETYHELGFYPEYENFSKLRRALLPKGIKFSDKTLKRKLIEAQCTLQSLLK